MSLDSLISGVAAALRIPEAQRSALRLEPIERSGNNRIYVVNFEGRKLLAKQYFQHPSDRRDRMHAERAFLEYAATAGIVCVPAVIAWDEAVAVGIYEYVEGRKLATGEIMADHVRQAAQFFLALNDPAYREAAAAVPAASEACFTIAGHLDLIERRIERLKTIPRGGGIDDAACDFADELAVRWRAIKVEVLQKFRDAGQDPGSAVEQRCISPSDFGFHNALLRESGQLCFLDFEYGGWDDPAKMVGDFFAHPGVPVPRAYLDEFLGTTMRFSPHWRQLEARARFLMPLFQIKWCCIVLNEFLPDAALRRRFADPRSDQTAGKRRQVEKARHLLSSI